MENLHPDFKEFLKLLNSHIDIDGISIPVISLSDLRQNKLASGRAKDLADLENLPPANNG